MPTPVRPLQLQIVHVVVHERRLRDMALRAAALAHEHALTCQFLLAGQMGIEPAERVELRRRRKIDDVLHLRHHRHLVCAIGQVDALPGSADMIAVEVCGALLEFGKILDRAQRPFRPMDLLVEQTAQAGRVETEARGLRPDIGRQMKGRVGVEVGMAIEAGYAQALRRHLAVLGLIEFLLWERRQEKPQPLHLNRRDDAVHDFAVVADRQQLAAGHVAQFRMGGQEYRNIGDGNSGVR